MSDLADPSGSRPARKLMRSEELQSRIAELMALAVSAGKAAENAALAAGEVIRKLPDPPDFLDEFEAQMMEAFEEHVLVARPHEGEATIDEREEQREIGKRALLHIHLPELKTMAETRGLVRGGTVDELVDRIARSFKYDQAAIARLVVEHEVDAPEDRRFSTRLFQLRDAPEDLTSATARIDLFSNRYIRTGIAKWVVLNNLVVADDAVSISGTFKTYRADAERLSEDEYALQAQQATAEANLSFGAAARTVRVDAKAVAESRALMSAFERASDLDMLNTLDLPSVPATGSLMIWDPVSVVVADMIQAHWRVPTAEVRNLITAGFVMGDADDTEDDDKTPKVRSVRFQGRHLLGSQTACELLDKGQRLAQITALMGYTTDRDSYGISLTIRIEKDHISVLSAIGTQPPTVVKRFHEEVVRGITKTLETGFADIAGVKKLAAEVHETAAS